MSKTFKSTNGGKNTLTVKQNLGDQVHFLAVSNSGERGGCAISRSEVPALVLAILEASGITATRTDTYTVGEPDNLARIAADLQHHIERRDARTKEAADRDVLWQEASDLYHSVFPDNPCYSTPAKMPEHLRDGWVRAALKAREIHRGTK